MDFRKKLCHLPLFQLAKKSSSTTSRALLAAELFFQDGEESGQYAADGIFTRWLCNEPSCTNHGQWCFVNPKEKSNGVSKHLIIKQSLLPMSNNYVTKGLGSIEDSYPDVIRKIIPVRGKKSVVIWYITPYHRRYNSKH